MPNVDTCEWFTVTKLEVDQSLETVCFSNKISEVIPHISTNFNKKSRLHELLI